MSDLRAPPSKRTRLVKGTDLPSKLIDVILCKCDAREQLLITGLSKNLREMPVRAMILSALEMSRTWPPMTSRDLQWTPIVRHVGWEPTDIKWRLEDRRSGDIVAVRADCRLSAEDCADLGMPPHCHTLEEFWTQNVMARKKLADLDEVKDDLTAPFATNLELDALFGNLTEGLDDAVPPEPDWGDLFAHEQLEHTEEADALFGADPSFPLCVSPLGGVEADLDAFFAAVNSSVQPLGVPQGGNDAEVVELS
ncbi:g7810 [Coccomyxa viridis]|uniref:G7810 protein n=1 Tax=Coccomyxa viridis TaxID=1274662 RepID=A0ABP1G5H1_9CHLO